MVSEMMKTGNANTAPMTQPQRPPQPTVNTNTFSRTITDPDDIGRRQRRNSANPPPSLLINPPAPPFPREPIGPLRPTNRENLEYNHVNQGRKSSNNNNNNRHHQNGDPDIENLKNPFEENH